MRVVVFGATGKTGEHAWKLLLEAGHAVTAFGRSVERRYADEPVARVQGDVLDADAVSKAIEAQDAVLVCLGPVSTKDQSTLCEGAANIASAMQAHGVRRVVFISAAGVGESWKQMPWYLKLVCRAMLRTIFEEHTREEEIFASSALDWTAVRAAVLTNKPATGRMVASNAGPIKTIPRADLAAFLVAELVNQDYVNRAISVTSGQ
ncbi:MAG: NAD(P)H-binding protein [Bryobacterales bacterium]|nr:NAD(P)H-binding protein [Bryobacterales bacterium]